jgi:hypothetical protein
MKLFRRLGYASGLALAASLAALWIYSGAYGFHMLIRHGASYWLPVGTDSHLLSPSMRRALAEAPIVRSGGFTWRSIAAGFEVAEMPVMAGDDEVDRIELARIDPARFRFVVRNAPAGDKDLDGWMAELGAALVVNGSYFSVHGRPATPVLSDGTLLGPEAYDAKAGAFVASAGFVAIRDLRRSDWQTAFQGPENALVSYPLLVAPGLDPAVHLSRWLANRSFVGQDSAGRIIIGTTEDAFFSLDSLARFLDEVPLELTIALNLDGGPVACQGIRLNGFERRTYGKWEVQVEGDRAKLLSDLYGSIDPMPVVLAVMPRE